MTTTTPIDAASVLALLEEKSYDSIELATVLELPEDTVHRFMLSLQRERRVKRVGHAQRCALPWFLASPGRPSTVDQQACRAQILQLLAGTSLSTEDLALRTGYSKHIIKHHCQGLKRAGALAAFGVSRGSRWCLPGYRPAPLAAAASSTAKLRAPSRSIKPTPGQRLAQGSSSGLVPADTFNLRRPPVPTTVDGESWWAKHAAPDQPRERFTQAAQQRDAEMRESSTAWRSPRPVHTVNLD